MISSTDAASTEPSETAAAVTPSTTAARPVFRTLPHEWAFGAFLLYIAARLILGGHAPSFYTPLFLLLFAGGIALCAWTGLRPLRLRWTIRLLWYPSIMGVSFYALSGVIPLLGIGPADGRLAGWDHALLGQPAAEFFIAVQTPLFTDFMLLAYLLFFFYLILGPAYYCLTDMPRFRSCMVGLFSLYALGFTGYTLLPAQDPLYTVPFSSALPRDGFAEVMLMALSRSGNGVDAFPSIHVAVTLYLLLFDFRHFRRRFRLLLLPCAALWISTLYLRYHYFVDVLAGAALALAGLVTAYLYARSRLADEIDAAAHAADSAQAAAASTKR